MLRFCAQPTVDGWLIWTKDMEDKKNDLLRYIIYRIILGGGSLSKNREEEKKRHYLPNKLCVKIYMYIVYIEEVRNT